MNNTKKLKPEIQNANPETACPLTKLPIKVPCPNHSCSKPPNNCKLAAKADAKITGITEV